MTNVIKFEKVYKAFGDKVVLNELDIAIPEGKITFILGKSGEGKSVTIKHIMGLLRPDRGEIIVDDEEITSFTDEQFREYRKKFGMLFQHAALFDSMSVGDNVLFPLIEHQRDSVVSMMERVEEVLEQVGLSDVIHKFPASLSIGEKKRVGLARALATKPKIMLYDEPTTGMDPLVSEMIDELIVELNEKNKEMTSVVISHDIKASMSIAENIVMLYQGKVALEGTPETFRSTDNPVIRQFFAGKIEGPMVFI